MVSVIDLDRNGGEIETFVGRLTDVMVAKGGESLCCCIVLVRKNNLFGGITCN